MFRKQHTIALIWSVLGLGLIVDAIRQHARHAYWEAQLAPLLDRKHSFYEDWVANPAIIAGVTLLGAAIILLIVWPYLASKHVEVTDPELLEAQRRIDAANARIQSAPRVDAPRARLPGEVEPEPLERPLPSPPRLNDDPFRSPPQRIIVAPPAPLAPAPAPLVPSTDDAPPKRLR